MTDIIKRLAKWRKLTPEHQDSVIEKAMAEIERLRKKVDDVYAAGMNGIGYVGTANYASRENEAQKKLRDIYIAK